MVTVWSQEGAMEAPQTWEGTIREVGCLGWDPRSATWSFYPSEAFFTFLHPYFPICEVEVSPQGVW